MGFLRGVGLTILIIIFSLIIISFSLLISFNQLLYPQIYEKAFDKGGVYSFLETQLKISENNNTRIMINELLEKSLVYIRGESDKLEINWNINNERINPLEMIDKDGSLKTIKSYVQVYKYSVYLSALILLILAIIIIMDERKRLRSGFEIIGIPLMIGGIIVVIISSIIGNLLYTQISVQLPIFQPAVLEIITPIFHSAKINGVITIIIGFTTMIIAFFVKNKKEKDDESKNLKKSLKVSYSQSLTH